MLGKWVVEITLEAVIYEARQSSPTDTQIASGLVAGGSFNFELVARILRIGSQLEAVNRIGGRYRLLPRLSP